MLKHSGHAFFTFIDYARCNHKTSGDEKPISIVELLDQDWDFETQKGNPVIDTNYLLSVLITDEQLKTVDSNVKPSKRNARYDGVITFGKSLTIIIENKPRSSNVWFDQLNPSRQNLADYMVVYDHPIGFESENSEHYLQFWKDNVDKIRQQKRAEVPKFLKSLADQNVLSMTKEAGEKLEERFYNTKMPSLNICPGFRLQFPIPNAEALDKDGKLKFILAEKIKGGLKVVGLDGSEILKKS